MVEDEKSELKRPCREYAYVLGTVILGLVAVLGPVYAFTIVSCVSTQSCSTAFALSPAGAWCEEGAHLEEEMLHGETCTVRCPTGRVPTVPELQCDDGFLHGADLLCAEDTTSPRPRDISGLVDGAVVGVDPGRACVEARDLECDAAPGDTGVLLVLYELPLHQCEALLDECKALNNNFLFVQHTGETSDEWVCTFGCRVPELTREPSSTEPAALTTTRSVVLQTPSPEARGCDGPPQGPFCFQMTGSCHEADNGDYYRAEVCVVGSPQWIKEDGTRRIRKDPVAEMSLGGRWLLEADFDADSDNYGNIFIARQPTFREDIPAFEDHVWNFECRVEGTIDLTIIYRPLVLDLVDCSCTAEGDCSGNGDAVGSKEEGPNCECICQAGFLGDHCETRYCEAPEIFGAYLPGCMEGLYIAPGEVCTPSCLDTRSASEAGLICVANENNTLDVAWVPPAFECILINDLLEQQDPFFTDSPPTSTTLIPCSNADCQYHGVATGFRSNNVCECICDNGFSGRSCENRAGSCQAPQGGAIEWAESQPCAEALNNISVGGVCTGQCTAGYYAVPDVLSCHGPGRPLVPATFRCFSSQTVEQQWCEAMQYVSLTASGVALLVLAAGCSVRGKRVIKKMGATFIVKGTVVEHHELKGIELQGDKGYMHVVRPGDGGVPDLNARQQNLRLVVNPQIRAVLPTEDDMVVTEVNPPMAVVADAETMPVGLGVATSIDPDDEQVVDMPGVPVALQDVESDFDFGWEEFGADRPFRQEPTVIRACSRSGCGARAEEVTEWLVHKQELEDKSNAHRAERDEQAENKRRQTEIVAAADVAHRLQATERPRAKAAAAIVEAFSSGDGDALKEAVNCAKALLSQLTDAPRSALLSLNRLVHLGEGRLLQYETKAARDADKERYEEKKRRGDVADWTMTQEELWMYVQQLDVPRVRAGLKAHLLVSVRTQDKYEQTLLHIACKQLGHQINDPSHVSKVLAVIKELVGARANTAAIDARGQTPLDLLLELSDLKLPDDAILQPAPALETLLMLGLQQSEAAAKRAQEERQAREAAQLAAQKSSLPSPRASSRQSKTCNSPMAGRTGSARGSRHGSRGSERGRPHSRGSLHGGRVLVRPGTVDDTLRKSSGASPRGDFSVPLQLMRPSTTSLISPKPSGAL